MATGDRLNILLSMADEVSSPKTSLDDVRGVLETEIFPALDAPIGYFSDVALQAIDIVRRGRDLYAALVAIEAQHRSAALILARALTEIAILAGWIEQKPDEHLQLWRAEADRNTLASLDRFNHFMERMGADQEPSKDPDPVARMRASVAAGKVLAERLSISNRSSLLPSLAGMSATDADAWDSYQIIYRMLSPEIHSAAVAYGSPRIRNRRGETYLVSGDGWPANAAILIATPQAVNLMAIVSRLAHLGLHDRLTALWDARNPPKPRVRDDSDRIGTHRLTARSSSERSVR